MLWNFAFDPVSATEPSRVDNPEWTHVGNTSSGEQIWERALAVGSRVEEFIVTVLFDPQTNQTHILYGARVLEGDRVPRIPTQVRREAVSFAKHLQTHVS